MRSEIACVRCAVSKTKCVNTGIDTTCRTCADRGLTCTYRPPKWSAGRSNQGNTSSHEEENDLDWSLLTPPVWTELGDIFIKHYSADLPFLSVPAVLSAVSTARDVDDSASQSTTSTPTRASTDQRKPRPELLLAFLALTGRFHPKLIRYHSMRHGKRQDRPYLAAEFYAAAASRKLDSPSRLKSREFDLQDVQVRLMLVVHAWTMHRGATAWIVLGEAIRITQVLGLHQLGPKAPPLSTALSYEADSLKIFVPKELPEPDDAEERRQTYSSCHALDCQLSLGKDRFRMLLAGELTPKNIGRKWVIEAPSDVEMKGSYGNEANGGRLSPVNTFRSAVPTHVAANDLVHRYGCSLDLLHRITQQRCHDASNTDTRPPWDSQSSWYQILRHVVDFQSSLPNHLKLTTINLATHRDNGLSGTFVHLHAIIFVSLGTLHADWLPFLPVRCSSPQGPLEGPLYPDVVKNAPPGFWVNSARHYFNSMFEILRLLQTQIEANSLPETPLMGWIAFRAVVATLYAHHFPYMDTEGQMGTMLGPEPMQLGYEVEDAMSSWPASRGPVATGMQVIHRVQEHSPMARQWMVTLQRLHDYTAEFREEFKRLWNPSPLSARQGKTLREGGPGGGADEFDFVLGRIRWFGELGDQDLVREDRA